MMVFMLSIPVFSQIDTIYFEDFTNNYNNWTEKNTDENFSKLENGNFVWQRKQPGIWTIWETLPGMNSEEFKYEVSFKIEGNGYFGLLWGAKDVNNGYYFLIHNSGYAQSFIYSRGNYEAVNEEIFAENMTTGFNNGKHGYIKNLLILL